MRRWFRGWFAPNRCRWRFEIGKAKTITDLAEHEGVTVSYVCRLLPLTGLAPDIVEAILDGRQPKGPKLAEMLGNGPVGWEEQRNVWHSGSISQGRITSVKHFTVYRQSGRYHG